MNPCGQTEKLDIKNKVYILFLSLTCLFTRKQLLLGPQKDAGKDFLNTEGSANLINLAKIIG